MMVGQRSEPLRKFAPLIVIGGGTALLFAYLLHRFPYDGLYGQDAYAYYYQARALFDEAIGKAPPAGALFSTDGLQHWPVGYHLQIIVGFLIGGEGLFGPRLLTIAMAALCPVFVYMLVGTFLDSEKAPWIPRFVGGAVAAFLLPLNGTYTRMGLSLMSDIPSLFWILLALYAFFKTWPPARLTAAPSPSTSGKRWAVLFGAALGIAVLTRYGSATIFAPLGIYLAICFARRRAEPLWLRNAAYCLILAAVAFAVAMLPQAIYLATHSPGTGVGDYLSGMGLSNLFSSGSVSTDGVASYTQPMIVFYLINPFWDTVNGFLSIFFLPLVLLGMAYLVRRRAWLLLTFLVVWWLVPGLFYAATPYQAHRFTLVYLPAIAICAGLGTYLAADRFLVGLHRLSQVPVWQAWAWRAVGLLVVVLLAMGTLQCWKSVRDWVATHAYWQAQDQQVAAAAISAAKAPPVLPGQPHVISFGATAAIYHYAQLPLIDLFNSNQKDVEQFVLRPGPTVVVVPVESLKTQWVGTPLGDLWTWMRSTFQLSSEGRSGDYTIYRLSALSPSGRSP